MRYNKWTLGLAAVGAISLQSAAQAEEAIHPVMSAVQSTTISGYVDTSAIWLAGPNQDAYTRNFNNTYGNVVWDTGGSYTPQGVMGRSFDGDDKQNGINLNVVDLTLEKPLDEGQWSAGYKVSMWLGPDANTLGTASTSSTGSSDFAVRNAYVALRAPVGNGLDFKFGVWDTVIGYEVADSPYNPNYSRSFAFFMEPITHTGFLTSYQVNDVVSVQGGIAGTGTTTINGRSGVTGVLTYMGSLALTAPESTGWLEGATLYGGIVDWGVSSMKVVNGTAMITQDIVNFYGGATMPLPCRGLALGVAYDYRSNGLFNGSYENAIGGYVSWQATEKMTLNGRFEYATGSKGSSAYRSVGSTTFVNAGNFGAWGVPGGDSSNVKMTGLTATVDYRLWGPALTRLEFRWDHAANGQNMYQGLSRKNIYSLALNVIYQF